MNLSKLQAREKERKVRRRRGRRQEAGAGRRQEDRSRQEAGGVEERPKWSR